MQYLVTGGTGYIGTEIIHHLLSKGDGVICLTRKELKSDMPNLTYVTGDISNLDSLSKICSEYSPDGIFHTAGVAGIFKSPSVTNQFHKANECGTFNVLSSALESSVKKVVFSSSSAIYGDSSESLKTENIVCHPKSYYGVSKLISEIYVNSFRELYGLSTLTLRYFNVYGPGQSLQSPYVAGVHRFIEKVLTNQSITMTGDGEQTRDFVYISDVANANILAMKSSAEGTYNIGSGIETTMNDIVRLIFKHTNKSVPVIHVPVINEDIRRIYADISSAKKEFGYSPQIDINEGIRKSIEYYMGD